ncbi:NUDIX domain-containing protein [Patescibacteria group bacterium]|nr:NUDIX domain-containing protein [Patescibacteria group bacterium]
MPLDDKLELFYWVDKNDKVLGSVKRGRAHQNREIIHRSVFIVVIDLKNRILLQKRSKYKNMLPEYWTVSASGHVTYGESYKQAAKKEIKEELGIDLDLRLIGKKLFDTGIEQEYSVIYKAQFKKGEVKFDKTEISEVKWVKIKNLREFVKKNKITPACKKVLIFMGLMDGLNGEER